MLYFLPKIELKYNRHTVVASSVFVPGYPKSSSKRCHVGRLLPVPHLHDLLDGGNLRLDGEVDDGSRASFRC
jgi:hypothetical protein